MASAVLAHHNFKETARIGDLKFYRFCCLQSSKLFPSIYVQEFCCVCMCVYMCMCPYSLEERALICKMFCFIL